MRLIRRVSLFAVLLVLAGCSTFRPEPATHRRANAREARRLVTYAVDRPTCEVARAQDMKPPPTAAWAELEVPAECRQFIVGSGADYWVYAVSGQGAVGANGASDREWCVKMREATAGSYRGLLGECQPVAVKAVP